MAKNIRVIMELDTTGFRRGIRDAEGGLDSLQKKGSDVASTLRGAFATIIGVSTIDQFVKMEAALTGLQNKLVVVAGSQEKANEAFESIAAISQRTRSSLADVGDLYSKIALAGEQLGLTQGQVAQTTETFTKALKLTGTSGAQASAAILQFGQALASGKLQGDEFRSLMENAPGYMGKLTKALGMSQGELRKLATEGALTADVIIAATQEMAASVEDDFAKTTPTILDAFTLLKTNVMLLFKQINEGTGVFEYMRKAVMFLAENIGVAFKFIGAMIAFAVGAKAVSMVFTFIKALQALRAATKAQTIAQAALLAMGGPAGLAALAAGAAAAAAAYIALDKAIPDSISFGEAPKPVDLGEAPSARALLEQSKAQAAAEKASEKARKQRERDQAAATRELNKQRAEAEKILQSAKDQNQLDKSRLATQLSLIGVGETESKIKEQQAKLEEDRLKAVRDIEANTLLSIGDRAAYIRQINEQYAEMNKNIEEGNKKVAERQAQFALAGELQVLGANLEISKRQFDQQLNLDREFNAARRQNMQERYNIDNEYFLAVEEANSRYENKQDINLKLELERLEKLRVARLAAAGVTGERRIKDDKERKTFGFGFEQAMGKFTEELSNEAAFAQRIFDTMTQGFTNSLLRFVETGKLSFGDLFRSLMAEIIKMQANKLFAAILGDGKGPGLASIGASIWKTITGKAIGGPVSMNKPYIVGERGPEMFIPRSNGSIMTNGQLNAMGSNGGTTMVNYNIQAVDALSFRQMLARDPEFLYNLTEQTRRGIPARRRQ